MMKNLFIPYQALSYGISGLGLLLALLAFRLLNKEQRKQKVRKPFLNTIAIYMAFCLVLAVLGVINEYLRNSVAAAGKTVVQEIDSSSSHNKQLNEGRQDVNQVIKGNSSNNQQTAK